MEANTPYRRRPGKDAPEFTGDIICTLHPDTPGGGPALYLERARALAEVNAFLGERGIPNMTPLIPDESQAAIEDLERQALAGPLRPLRTLNAYWRIDANAQGDEADELVASLLALPEVDTAYRETTPHDSFVNAPGNPFSVKQTYLNPAPEGIDARFMWALTNGDGTGVGVADVEEAWNLAHEDLIAKLPAVVFGDNLRASQPDQGNHGTSVLAVVAAADNHVGVVGIAPAVSPVRVASRFKLMPHPKHTHVAAAIGTAATTLSPGDVIVVEVERVPGLPTEVEQADFDAIRLATGSGRVVVEAAGNGPFDLDKRRVRGKLVFKRGSGDFLESGAIMVGAATAKHPHVHAGNSGSRIDCYAHGEKVVTAGNGDLTPGPVNPNKHYTGIFDGTSAAAAIIAGAAILVQGRFKFRQSGRVLQPLDLRDILSKPVTGTAPASGKIGVMPNLAAIVAANPDLQ